MNWIEVFKEKGAFLEGHFLLSSGMHSPNYLQCALILQYPDLAEKIAKEIAEKIPKNLKIDTVIGPALGGIIIAYELARALDIRGIFAEREEGKMTLRRGFSISKGERVLVCEDVVTTGGSALEVANLVKSFGGEIIAYACIVDRSGGKTIFDKDLYSLIQLKLDTYNPEECPFCKDKIPLTKPGSRNLK
ncbi:MAG TPA: orotate phosphoribosyltransferase [Dictyoglomaceae bacterium]|nr:orotate phosphoribosyltransferase [Dictyoglomaceae bacterium]HOL39534.1 orotate phosphoribosyltransferase [Dictyoglomaceae bacterium]HOP94673.1 orotate phosphoribosyltransferase [Dictyoglomaceae bacterium]HPP16087.1 orotate phosphoribosyltransferase [Dictyoglomaceae bacterium]HPU43022.1 orotate phosphoribosyltransferase [Dictyoglomaceae bacterium]